MNIKLFPDDIELTIRIDGGELEFQCDTTGITFKVVLSESDMDYLKERLKCWK